MSTAIVKFSNSDMMFYCKEKSYPCGLGFELLDIFESNREYMKFLCDGNMRFVAMTEIPHDIQYEYVISEDGIHAQECWYTADKSYHGGGIRHGTTFDLQELRKKVALQQEYSFRRPEAWNK